MSDNAAGHYAGRLHLPGLIPSPFPYFLFSLASFDNGLYSMLEQHNENIDSYQDVIIPVPAVAAKNIKNAAVSITVAAITVYWVYTTWAL
ncbi:hypothetical protein N643_17520 [Salmonella bongori serovar 48:z41:-- str. RKS3044]|nr:hypothetical protein [Salmonella bongori]AID27659.1 hypothetical protein N643_17520 [Salmonella bongori serovar 48:z41:-- str. RKS3044]